MCQKLNTTKRFFVLLNHPVAMKQPYVMTVLRDRPDVQTIMKQYEKNQQTFLVRTQTDALGIKSYPDMRTFLLPIDIPRDWFLH